MLDPKHTLCGVRGVQHPDGLELIVLACRPSGKLLSCEHWTGQATCIGEICDDPSSTQRAGDAMCDVPEQYGSIDGVSLVIVGI